MRKYLQLFLLLFSVLLPRAYAQDTTLLPSAINDTIFPLAENETVLEYKILSSSQANYIISVLRECKEIVLYCGHEDEIETYMVLCDSWKSQLVNYEEITHYDSMSDSWETIEIETLSGWYEIWVLGFDLHTGDTICTPIDPYCMWFHKNDSIHNVGNYTFLDSATWSFPFNWKVPQYTLINCLEYAEDLQTTYHYDIHVFGYFVPYCSMPSPPTYYKRVKSTPQPHAGHRPSPSGRLGLNSLATTSGDSDTSTINNPSHNQHIDNQAHLKDSIHRVADTIQLQHVGQITQQRVEPQEKQINFQQTEKEIKRIEQPQPQKEEKPLTEIQRLQAEIQRQRDIIQQQQAEIQKLQAEVKQQQAKISSQQAEITNQRSEIQRQQTKISSQQSEIQQQKNEIQQQKSKIANQQLELQRKQGDVKQHR